MLHPFLFTFFVPDLSFFDIDLLPRDVSGNVIYPRVPKEKGSSALNNKFRHFSHFEIRKIADTPPGEAPKPAFNLTVETVAGGWVLKWLGDLSDTKLQV